MEFLQNVVRFLSNYALSAVVLVILIAIACIYWVKRKGTYKENERFVNSIPSWASTVGVIGTFVGITAGLMEFDTRPELLDKSIETLLEGLKTAFYTSLLGMFGSWGLSLWIDKLLDKDNVNKPSSETEAIHEMTAALKGFSDVMTQQSQKMQEAFSAFTGAITQIRMDVQSINTSIKDQGQKQMEALDAIATSNTNVTTAINTMTEDMKKSLSEVSDHTGDLLDTVGGMASTFNVMHERMEKQDDIMRGYIDDILRGMTGTNDLLTRKFDEFTELMKQSNTEALKAAMESALAKLNEQMSDLINRLVTDNFTRLTECVEQLSTWQKENKEMIAALTKQYKEMETDFEGTNTSLTGVAQSVNTLTSDSGKLNQIVNALQKVMVDDERFVKMTSNLSEAAESNKQITENFKEEVNALNEWVRKQRDFVDAVNALIITLKELSEIRNYSQEFWQETKKSMNDGVAIIADGSRQLNSQIGAINQEFYERLSNTLSSLDACIRAIIENRR